MRYIIYGTGAIGGVVGAKLFMHGKDVILIARGAQLQALKANGLTLRYPDGEVNLQIPTVGHPNEIGFQKDDVVVMCVKSQDSQAALAELRAAAGDQVNVLCCQNGLDNERMALRLFPNVYAQVVFMPAMYLEPGIVECSTWPKSGVFDLGRYPRGTDATAEAIARDFDDSDMLSNAEPNIMSYKYTKMLQILANPVQAVCGLTDAGDIVDRIRAEATACYDAAGFDYVTMEVAQKRQMMSSRTTSGRLGGASTWQSLQRGAGSIEVDYLNGEVALLGRLHGVPTPANESLQMFADSMARNRQAPGSVSPDAVRAEIARREGAATGAK